MRLEIMRTKERHTYSRRLIDRSFGCLGFSSLKPTEELARDKVLILFLSVIKKFVFGLLR